MKNLIVILLLLVAGFVKVNSQLSEPIPSIGKHSLLALGNDISNLIANPDFINSQIGIHIQSVENGEVLFEYNADKNFIPASTQKIITTFAGLSLLGKDYKFSTKMYLDGEIDKQGTFTGNIFIKGGGDPTQKYLNRTQDNNIIENFTKCIQQQGIKYIRGNFIGDDSFFDPVKYGQGWLIEDLNYSFSAQVSALSINNNSITINIIPNDSIGLLANIELIPKTNYVQIINKVTTVEEDDIQEIVINRDPFTNIFEIKGTIRKDTTHKKETLEVSIHEPSKYFLTLLEENLRSKGIKSKGDLYTISELSFKPDFSSMFLLSDYKSIALSDVIKEVNKKSQNLYSECILKTIGKLKSGLGNYEKSLEQINTFLSNNGITPQNINIYDGSGLSRYNLISPKYLNSFLRTIWRSELKDIFINSLAVPGEEGTLRRRMIKSLAEKNIHAKTGSMNNVSSISGFIQTRDKETLAFTIIHNNFTVPQSSSRNLQDLICMRLAAFSRN